MECKKCGKTVKFSVKEYCHDCLVDIVQRYEELILKSKPLTDEQREKGFIVWPSMKGLKKELYKKLMNEKTNFNTNYKHDEKIGWSIEVTPVKEK